MNLKQAANVYPLFKTIYEKLTIKTSMGREMILGLEFSNNKDHLQRQYTLTEDCIGFLGTLTEREKMMLECVLYDVHNIRGSLKTIENGESLDDIGLFEIKAFCLSCKKLQSICKGLTCKEFSFNKLQEVIDLLDPEKLENNQFYIYPAYHPDLSQKRRLFEKYKKEDDPRANEIYEEISTIENEVREKLCKKIVPYIELLKQDIDRTALLDITIAKAELTKELELVVPEITEEHKTQYKSLFNPVIDEHLKQRGKSFQPIDIEIESKPILITGANMSGKTVVLKTLALSQLMAQFGMFVPCKACKLSLFEDILCSIGDNQNENEGLSSFASEILILDNIVRKIKDQKTYLVLVDELARTTNPEEGVKLLQGFLKTMALGQSLAVVTTHYSNIEADCKRLRVKGFIGHNLTPPISLTNLADNVDYSLIEDNNRQAPNEAINLCRLLGIDSDWLEKIDS